MMQCPVCGKYSVSFAYYGCGYKCVACGYAPTIVYSNQTEPDVGRPIHDHMVDTHWITEHKINPEVALNRSSSLLPGFTAWDKTCNRSRRE